VPSQAVDKCAGPGPRGGFGFTRGPSGSKRAFEFPKLRAFEFPKLGPHAPGHECRYEVRGFAAPVGIDEDPVTGSLNASLAQWLIGDGLAPARYTVAQGVRLARAGRVYIDKDDEALWVGGHTALCIQGNVEL